jgi:hypothetical protein
MEYVEVTIKVPVGYEEIAKSYAIGAVKGRIQDDLRKEIIESNQPILDEMVNEVELVNNPEIIDNPVE